MTHWLASYWYIVTGIAGTAIYLAFVTYANRHPDGLAMSLWQRSRYAFAASIVVGAALGLFLMILSAFFPRILFLVDILFSHYFFVLFAVMWFVAPYLRRLIPLERTSPNDNAI